MKRNKKIMSAILAMTVFATSVFAIPMDAQAASMKLNKTKATIKVGESVTLKVKNTKKKVKWSSSKRSVATVTVKGKVTGKKAGTAKITAKVGTKKLSCNVTVKKKTTSNSKYSGNYKRLVNYIKTYGRTNSSGDKVIQDTYVYNSTMAYKYGIIYMSKKNTIEFVSYATSTGSTEFTDGIAIDVKLSKLNQGEGMYVFTSDNSGILCHTTTSLSKIKSKNNNLNWQFDKVSNGTVSAAKKLTNSQLSVAYLLWDDLVKDNVGMNLTDLGFGK